MNFVVLSSSRGTTFQAVLDAMKAGTLHATCLGLVSDRADRGCVEKAKAAGLTVKIVEREKGEEREAYDRRLNDAIHELGDVDIIAALGWMFILTAWFVEQWNHRIINVHPALLPKFPGGNAIQEALEAKETVSGMSIHIIDEGVDTGKILVQKNCTVEPDDTEESLKERIQELEKEWYPKVLEQIHTGEISLPN